MSMTFKIRVKIHKKNFSGRGTAPPEPHPQWGGGSPSPCLTPSNCCCFLTTCTLVWDGTDVSVCDKLNSYLTDVCCVVMHKTEQHNKNDNIVKLQVSDSETHRHNCRASLDARRKMLADQACITTSHDCLNSNTRLKILPRADDCCGMDDTNLNHLSTQTWAADSNILHSQTARVKIYRIWNICITIIISTFKYHCQFTNTSVFLIVNTLLIWLQDYSTFTTDIICFAAQFGRTMQCYGSVYLQTQYIHNNHDHEKMTNQQ